MALYVPAGRRRRNAVVIGVVAALLGIVVGVVIGRTSVTGYATQVRSHQDAARTIVARLDALPIEYEQALSGTGDTGDAGVSGSIAAIRADVAAEMVAARFIGPAVTTEVEAAVDAVGAAATARQPLPAFQAAVDDATTTIAEAFGIDGSG